jgi:hypothetical protein
LLRPVSAPGTGQSLSTPSGAVGVPAGAEVVVSVGLPGEAVSVEEGVPSRSVPETVWTSVGLAVGVWIGADVGEAAGGSVSLGSSPPLVHPARAAAPMLASSVRRDQRSIMCER